MKEKKRIHTPKQLAKGKSYIHKRKTDGLC